MIIRGKNETDLGMYEIMDMPYHLVSVRKNVKGLYPVSNYYIKKELKL